MGILTKNVDKPYIAINGNNVLLEDGRKAKIITANNQEFIKDIVKRIKSLVDQN